MERFIDGNESGGAEIHQTGFVVRNHAVDEATLRPAQRFNQPVLKKKIIKWIKFESNKTIKFEIIWDYFSTYHLEFELEGERFAFDSCRARCERAADAGSPTQRLTAFNSGDRAGDGGR